MAVSRKNTLRDKILNAVAVIVLVAFGFFVWRDVTKEEVVAVPADAVDLEFPLSGGQFYVMYSGPDDSLYGYVHTSLAEKYALDIVKDNGAPQFFGSTLENDPSFGTSVTSPCTGQVVWAQNNKPDLPIGQKDPGAVANSVTIKCDAGFEVVMAHFKQGSVVVNVDQRIVAGDPVAVIGNTGNTAGPHLHIAAFLKDGANSGTVPLPIKFGGRYLQKGDRVPE